MSAIRTDVGHLAATDTLVEQTAHANKVSWGAILSGVAIALAAEVTFVLVGAGIGAAALDIGVDAASNADGSSLPMGAAIWSLGSILISTFLGGFVAARLSGRTAPSSAGLHGVTTWAVTTLLILYLLTTSVGSILGGAFSGVTSVIGGIGSTVAQTAAPALADMNPLDAIENQVRSTGADPEALQANAVSAIRAFVTGGDDAQAGEQAAQALAAARGIPVDQAQQQVAQIEQQYRAAVDSAQQTATEAAEVAASVVATGALVAAAALLLGALAGWLGGLTGRIKTVPVRRL